MPHTTDRDYASCLASGMNLKETAEHLGASYYATWSYARKHDLDYDTKRGVRDMVPTHYSTVDNAVTAAFRAVLGRCPFRDSDVNSSPSVIPKVCVTYDPVFGPVVSRRHKQ